jgi:hypothetical protein
LGTLRRLLKNREDSGPEFLLSEEPEDDGQKEAEENAGDDGEVEGEVAAGVMDVAGEAAEPAATDPGPEEGADGGQKEAGEDEEFADVTHKERITFPECDFQRKGTNRKASQEGV